MGHRLLKKHYRIWIKAFLRSCHRATATGQFKKIQLVQRLENLILNHVVLVPPSPVLEILKESC